MCGKVIRKWLPEERRTSYVCPVHGYTELWPWEIGGCERGRCPLPRRGGPQR